MYCDGEKVFVEEDDICMTCENYVKEFSCPLLLALGAGDVFMEDNLVVTKCGFYKEFKRLLHIIKESDENEDDNTY